MNKNNKCELVDWKLKFRVERVDSGQRVVCVVQSAHIFRGNRLVFVRPEYFEMIKLRVGAINQFRLMEDTKSIPCVVLHDQEFKMDVAAVGISHTIEVVNTSEWAVPFYAELYGIVLVKPGEKPRVSDWEDYLVSNSSQGNEGDSTV